MSNDRASASVPWGLDTFAYERLEELARQYLLFRSQKPPSSRRSGISEADRTGGVLLDLLVHTLQATSTEILGNKPIRVSAPEAAPVFLLPTGDFVANDKAIDAARAVQARGDVRPILRDLLAALAPKTDPRIAAAVTLVVRLHEMLQHETGPSRGLRDV